MGREYPTERALRRHRALIDAARELFIAHGYRGTTLEAIIARAGGSRQTIYRDLGGKRGLFDAIIGEASAQFGELTKVENTMDHAPREALIHFGEHLAAIWRSEEGRAINRIVLSEGLESSDLLDSWFVNGPEQSIASLASYLRSQDSIGVLNIVNPELTARQFLTLLMGEFAFPSLSRTERPSQALQIARCVDLILAAHAVVPPTSDQKLDR